MHLFNKKSKKELILQDRYDELKAELIIMEDKTSIEITDSGVSANNYISIIIYKYNEYNYIPLIKNLIFTEKDITKIFNIIKDSYLNQSFTKLYNSYTYSLKNDMLKTLIQEEFSDKINITINISSGMYESKSTIDVWNSLKRLEFTLYEYVNNANINDIVEFSFYKNFPLYNKSADMHTMECNNKCELTLRSQESFISTKNIINFLNSCKVNTPIVKEAKNTIEFSCTFSNSQYESQDKVKNSTISIKLSGPFNCIKNYLFSSERYYETLLDLYIDYFKNIKTTNGIKGD